MVFILAERGSEGFIVTFVIKGRKLLLLKTQHAQLIANPSQLPWHMPFVDAIEIILFGKECFIKQIHLFHRMEPQGSSRFYINRWSKGTKFSCSPSNMATSIG